MIFLRIKANAAEFMQHKANIYISSDGGCRVNEGISSTGWVVRAVGWDMHGTTKVIELASGGTFLNKVVAHSKSRLMP